MFKINYNLSEIDSIAREILDFSKHPIICFQGEMGAGKTSLIKAILKQLEFEGEISSPTFGIVNEYDLPQNQGKVFHFDLYRIDHISEIYDIGFEDYLENGKLILIEWPNIAEELLPADRTIVNLKILGTDERGLCVMNQSKTIID